MISHNNKKLKVLGVSQALAVLLASFALVSLSWGAPAPQPPGKLTKFSNIGSIANTRHNLTQDTAFDSGGYPIAAYMGTSRNQYGEVCVYCHTPHGANLSSAQVAGFKGPLWNRTIKVTNYQTYDELGTTSLTQDVTSSPGSASLTCLSCHDGQTAIDSIINMPGSGMGNTSQWETQNTAFLDSWPPGGGGPTSHMGLNSTNGVLGNGQGSLQAVCSAVSPGAGWTQLVPNGCGPGISIWTLPGQGCLTCHADTGDGVGAGVIADFRLFNIGTDLRNDHPIGITFPTSNGPGTDWNTPAGVQGSSNYFETIANGRMDKEEIRTYDGRVECASCHDPHGVPTAGPGTVFNKTFLRKQNTNGSAVCLTCHNK